MPHAQEVPNMQPVNAFEGRGWGRGGCSPSGKVGEGAEAGRPEAWARLQVIHGTAAMSQLG